MNLDLILLIALNILKLMKSLIRSTKKKQMVLELEVNAIGTSIEKNLQKFFLNLEKSLAVQNQIRNILIGNKEVNSQQDINNELYLHYKNLFNKKQNLSEHDINNFLNGVSKFPQLSTEQSLECEKFITEKELYEALKSMPIFKSPGSDGLT